MRPSKYGSVIGSPRGENIWAGNNPMPNFSLTEQLERLESAAMRLGVPLEQCLTEAIEDWLTVVAPARLESISHFEKPDNVVEFK
jgi:hypothetical protein